MPGPRTIVFAARAALAMGLAALAAGCGGDVIVQERASDRRDLPEGLTRLVIEVPSGPVTVSVGAPGVLDYSGAVRRWARDEQAFAAVAAIPLTPTLTPVPGEPGTWRYAVAEVPPTVDDRFAALVVKCAIELPAEIAVDVRTGRGEAGITGRRAAVRLRTSAGRVLLEGNHGPTDVETGDGEIVVHGHRGDLRAVTGSGTILAYVDEFGPGGVLLDNGGPSMIVHLPAGSGFDLDARVDRSNDGKVGVRQSFGLAVETVGKGHRAVGSVGGGGPPVQLRTGRGYLSVVTRAAPTGG